MVLRYLKSLLPDRFGCDEEDVTLAATFDELNLSADDTYEIVVCLQDLYGIEIPADCLQSFETLEDMVGYVEDRL
ncbi:MAG: hypothetical protein IJO59_06460 [Clostridia bacterium]|nr:hypothetical protein [Clostridia bacterium]